MSKRGEMASIFRSYEYLIKEKLESIDNMTRNMQREMATMGVKKSEVSAYLPEQFKRLVNEVAEQQYNQYDRKGESA